jgi:coenzyme Q-binding protein COQ10
MLGFNRARETAYKILARKGLMPQYQTSRHVQHSAAHMFELVADVERYPEFVPLCRSLRVRGRSAENGHDVITATMTVAYKLLSESFTTRIILDREANEIRVSYIDGPFRYLENVWSFEPTGETSCRIGFRIDYEFRSRILQALMGAAFDTAFRKFANAFEARADQIYGRSERRDRTVAGQGVPLKGSPSA